MLGDLPFRGDSLEMRHRQSTRVQASESAGTGNGKKVKRLGFMSVSRPIVRPSTERRTGVAGERSQPQPLRRSGTPPYGVNLNYITSGLRNTPPDGARNPFYHECPQRRIW